MAQHTTPAVHLSPRERTVLELIAEGLADKQIATRLGVSVRTVRTHVDRVFQRHDLHSRTAAVGLLPRAGESVPRPD